METIFSIVKDIQSGAKIEQVFIGCTSMVSNIYAIKFYKKFINILHDNIHVRGEPTILISDLDKVDISNKVQEVLRLLHIITWNSYARHQHQNHSERIYQDIKSTMKIVMDIPGTPESMWFL